MNRRQMFSTGARLLMGLAGIVITRQLSDVPSLTDLRWSKPQDDLHVFVHAESREFQKLVIDTVVDDVKRNGPMRALISDTAGG